MTTSEIGTPSKRISAKVASTLTPAMSRVPSPTTVSERSRRRIAQPSSMPKSACKPMCQPKCSPASIVTRNEATAAASSDTRGPRRSIRMAKGVGTAMAKTAPITCT